MRKLAEVVYCHKGSFFHPFGNPIAVGSTTGYFESRALMSFVNVLAGLMLLSQQHTGSGTMCIYTTFLPPCATFLGRNFWLSVLLQRL